MASTAATRTDLEYVSCNLCGKDDASVIYRDRGPLEVVRCRGDGLVYMNPRPGRAEVRNFHSDFVRTANLEYFGAHRREILRREAAVIQGSRTGGRLLDIGCATGTFFENFNSPGWQLFGVDTSPLGSRMAAGNHAAEISCGTVREAAYPSNYFDCITMLDTLYYSPDPSAELAEIARILKDDGLLGIEIPGYTYTRMRNRGPLCWALDGVWSRGYTKTHKLYYFSPRTLTMLLARQGLSITAVVPEQASLGRGGMQRIVNRAHFAVSRALFAASGGRLTVTGKELYLAVKDGPRPGQEGSPAP